MTIRINFYLFILLTLILSVSGCAFISMPMLPQLQPLQEQVIAGTGKNKILLINISGIISEKDKSGALGLSTFPNMISRVKEELDMASLDPDIKAVLLKINSPGGGVTASDIIYNELVQYKKRSGVKIVASLFSMATSGGYYIASSADKIIAHPTTITGSIGVIAFNLKIYELMAKIGIQNDPIKSGKKKDLMSPFRASTKEETEIMQGVINTLYEQFLDVVANGRSDLTKEEIRPLADGRIYTAKEALRLKLIDEIGYSDDAITLAKKEAGISDATVVRYRRPHSYKNNIYSKTTPLQAKNINLINIDMESITQQLTPEFMYLWTQ